MVYCASYRLGLAIYTTIMGLCHRCVQATKGRGITKCVLLRETSFMNGVNIDFSDGVTIYGLYLLSLTGFVMPLRVYVYVRIA